MRSALAIFLLGASLRAQDLSPRAYVLAPKGATVLTVSAAFNHGDISFDPSLPVRDAKATIQVPMASVVHAFSFFGRSANVLFAIPYVHGNLSGTLQGIPVSAERSGLADMRVRTAVNIYGGKAMALREFAQWNERTTLGVSVTVGIPASQYAPARLVNIGTNRWFLKPELGFTRRWGKWAADLYGGFWVFTDNDRFFPGEDIRSQSAVLSGEGHVGYYLGPRAWVTFDANFWTGGQTSRNGIRNDDRQRNSRMGATISLPLGRSQAIKFAYSRGAYVTIGADYNTFNIGWQYTWLRR